MAIKCNVNVTIQIDDYPAIGIADRFVLQSDNPERGCVSLSSLLASLAGGGHQGRVLVAVDNGDGTAATGTVTVTQANATDGDTVTVAGVVLTRKAVLSVPAVHGEFLGTVDDATAAAQLGSAIAAHPDLKGVVKVSVATNVVTLSGGTLGVLGNLISLAASDGTFTAVSGALLTGGAAGAETVPVVGFLQGGV